MELLTARFAQIATQIDATTAQITALQAQLSELQEHQQQLLSVEQACQSALSQVDTALMMLHHVDPSQVAVFKEAMVAKFSTEVIAQLPASPEPEPVPEPTPAPAPAPEPEAPAVDVEIAPIIDQHLEPEPEETATVTELNQLSIQIIRKLASKKKVGGSGTRAEIASRLAGLVTKDEIWKSA
jgi:DNA polymerase III gamma/tau subunit